MAQQEPSTKKRMKPGGGSGHHMSFEKPKNSKIAGRRLWIYIKGYTPVLLFAIIFIIIGVLLRVAAPTFMGNAITEHLERSLDLPAFMRELGLLLGIYLGMFVANAISSILVAYASNKLIYHMREDGFSKLQKLSLSFYDTAGVGDIISRMTNDIETIYNAFSNGFSQVISGMFSLIGTLIAMFVLNVSLSFAVLAVIPIVLVFVISLGKKVRVKAQTNQKQVGKLNTSIEESVEGMKVIQTFNREEESFKRFDQTNKKTREAAIAFFSESFKMMPVMTFMNGLSLAIVIGLGGILVIKNPSIYSIGLISAFIMYARQFFEPIRQVSNIYNMYQSALAGAERFFQIIDSEDVIIEPEEPFIPTDPQGTVEFKDVTFAYVKDKPVLEHISLEANSGMTTAIVGPTGAGKTTIVNLLSRFYDIEEGQILIDGVNIKDYSLASLRAMMGVVLQEPFFFAGTIRDNLMYGRLDSSEEGMIEAAKLANAHHFISCMPEGYATVLTERGMNISQGERQLLAIARTILADPKILILDEATSSIDSLTESHIQQAMMNLMKGKTSFIIAHRLSTIKNADNLLVIHNHTIIEQGNHTDLMAADGFYSKLYTLQFEQNDVLEDMIN